MKVRFTRPALADLDDIVDYIKQDSPAAAMQVEEAIRNTAALLGHFPQMGHLKYLPGVRMMPIRRYPYLLFYIGRGSYPERSAWCEAPAHRRLSNFPTISR